MKPALLGIIAFLYITAFVNAQGNIPENEIRELEKAEATAVLNHDTAALEEIWSADFTVNTPLNTIGTRKRGDRIRLAYSFLERNIEKLNFPGDNLVITMGSETVIPKGEMPMAGQTLHRRFTNIWMKIKGKWQLIARHANIICPEIK